MRLRSSHAAPASDPQPLTDTATIAQPSSGRERPADNQRDRGGRLPAVNADRYMPGGADLAAGELTARVLAHRTTLSRSPLVVVASLEAALSPFALAARTAEALFAAGHAALLAIAHGGEAPPNSDEQEGLAGRLRDPSRHPPLVTRAPSGLSILPAGRWSSEADLDARRGGLDRVLRASALHFDAVLVDVGFRREDELAAISAGCDAALLVVRRNHTPITRIETAIERLSGRGVTVLATILG